MKTFFKWALAIASMAACTWVVAVLLLVRYTGWAGMAAGAVAMASILLARQQFHAGERIFAAVLAVFALAGAALALLALAAFLGF